MTTSAEKHYKHAITGGMKFMADVETKPVDTTGEQKTTETVNNVEVNVSDEAPTLASLQAQIQSLMFTNAKQKKALDKATSEAADFKRKYNATLSEQEQASMEKAEKEAEREQKFNELVRENNINKLEKTYLAMNYTADEAARMATAEIDGDLDAKLKIMQEVDTRKATALKAEWQKTIPQANTGTGGEDSGVTAEEFSKMGYLARKELKDKYPETYRHFMNGGK